MDPDCPRGSPRESVQDVETGDLLSPISLASLDTPNSRSSLTFPDSAEISPTTVPPGRIAEEDPFWVSSDSDLAPSRKESTLEEQTEALNLADSNLPPEKERTHHYPDETPKAAGASMTKGVQQAIEASKKLQQVLGQQRPVPFKTPPYMPPNLMKAFEEGLVEYGLGVNLRNLNLSEQEAQQTGAEKTDQDIWQGHSDKGKGKAKVTEDIQAQGHGQPAGQQDVVMEVSAAPPVLFPPPNIESGKEIEADLPSENQVAQPANVDGFLTSLFSRPPPTASPKVTSAPVKLGRLKGKDRKRARAESKQEAARPAPVLLQKKARTEGITGIPALPVGFDAAWMTDFPGNCMNLSQILLRWHHTMTTLYRRCQEDFMMEVHPVFPYPPTRPANIPLVSISFWDTSSEPHRELRFVGPGDVSSILYAEVDTFHSAEDTESSAFAKAMASGKLPDPKDLRKVDMRARNERGEGRWCFVVINANKKEGEAQGSVAPYVTLAWPTTAVTGKSECLHTIYPDQVNNPPSAASSAATAASGPKPMFPPKVSMMPNMYPGFLVAPGIHSALRAATSTTLPPPATALSPMGMGNRKGELTVRRTTLQFQKAGGLPLIQAYRTDVASWKGFLDAVGKGCGKVMMSCEVK